MSNLDITTPISEIEVDGVIVPMASGGITEETDPTVPEYIKNITEEDIQNWNNKASIDEVEQSISEVVMYKADSTLSNVQVPIFERGMTSSGYNDGVVEVFMAEDGNT